MNSSNTSSPQASASLKVIGHVDHSILDSENLILVLGNPSQIIMNINKVSDDEGAQADHSHSNVSTPDMQLTSVRDIPVGDKHLEESVETPKDSQPVVENQEAKA